MKAILMFRAVVMALVLLPGAEASDKATEKVKTAAAPSSGRVRAPTLAWPNRSVSRPDAANPAPVVTGRAEVTDGGAADPRSWCGTTAPARSLRRSRWGSRPRAPSPRWTPTSWTCAHAADRSCEWPTDVPPGGDTATATASFGVLGPTGTSVNAPTGSVARAWSRPPTSSVTRARTRRWSERQHPSLRGDDFATVGGGGPDVRGRSANDGDADDDPLSSRSWSRPDGTVVLDPGSERFCTRRTRPTTASSRSCTAAPIPPAPPRPAS